MHKWVVICCKSAWISAGSIFSENSFKVFRLKTSSIGLKQLDVENKRFLQISQQSLQALLVKQEFNWFLDVSDLYAKARKMPCQEATRKPLQFLISDYVAIPNQNLLLQWTFGWGRYFLRMFLLLGVIVTQSWTQMDFTFSVPSNLIWRTLTTFGHGPYQVRRHVALRDIVYHALLCDNPSTKSVQRIHGNSLNRPGDILHPDFLMSDQHILTSMLPVLYNLEDSTTPLDVLVLLDCISRS